MESLAGTSLAPIESVDDDYQSTTFGRLFSLDRFGRIDILRKELPLYVA